MSYDVLYQEWLAAHKSGDYATADRLREQFERENGLTIFAEGEMPIVDVTVRPMLESVWQKKYGNPEVGRLIAEYDSFVRQKHKRYRGLIH